MTTSSQPLTAAGGPTLGPPLSAVPADGATAVDERLLAAARAIGPVIREHADRAERERRLPKPVLEALASAGLQRMFTPKALGGLEVDPVTCARVVEEVAGFDSAAAWALQASNTAAWWSSRLPLEGVAELYARGPDLTMAASFHPPHRAVEVPGGYRFTGRGPLASTIHDSEWVMMTGLVMDGDQPRMTPAGPEIVSLAMRVGEVEVLDTWHSLGMRGTDSNDVAVNDVFVPASRAFRLDPSFQPVAPFDGPIYRLPALSSVVVVVAPVALAIARGAVTALRELAQRKTAFGSMKTLRDRPTVQATLAEAEGVLRSARLLFYDALASTWRRALAGQPNTLEHRADLLLASAHAAKSAWTVAELMHRLGGTSGVYAASRLERHFRDAATVRHHGFVCESRLEAVGQIYLGVQPEFGLIVF